MVCLGIGSYSGTERNIGLWLLSVGFAGYLPLLGITVMRENWTLASKKSAAQL